MKFQLVSRQTSESLGTESGVANTQLTFTGADNPSAAGPGIYYSNIVLAVTQAEAANYQIGDYYDLALTPSA